MEKVTDITVMEAIRDLIIGLEPCPVPKTTLARTTNVGATELPVANPGPNGLAFPDGSLATVNDGSSERLVRISGPTATSLPLDFSGMNAPDGSAQTGLQFSHQAGSIVVANLFCGMTIEDGPLLATGLSRINVMVMRQEDHLRGMPRYFNPVYAVHIDIATRLLPPQGSQIDVNLWSLEQQRNARLALEPIANLLEHNTDLVGNAGRAAAGIGGLAGEPATIRDWTRLLVDLDVYQFNAALNANFYDGKSEY